MPIPTPNPGESFDKFIERCMSDDNMVSEYPQDQRFAICSMKFSNKDKATNPKNEETFTDYPKAATENAKRALKWKEENGNKNDCGTLVGWMRANQLAKKEPISLTTVKRMAAFIRHKENKDVSYDQGCGGLMWDAWGGDEGINWAINKIESLK
jgi:hypothetical protein